jgi:hypothetical protein
MSEYEHTRPTGLTIGPGRGQPGKCRTSFSRKKGKRRDNPPPLLGCPHHLEEEEERQEGRNCTSHAVRGVLTVDC